MFAVIKDGMIMFEPQFQVSKYASNHGKFSFWSMRKVYLDMVLADVWINPNKDLFIFIEEDHILVDHEVTVVLAERVTGRDNCTGVDVCFL